jgi:hypothetical protein
MLFGLPACRRTVETIEEKKPPENLPIDPETKKPVS